MTSKYELCKTTAHAYFLLSKAWRISLEEILEEMPVPTHAHHPPTPHQGPLSATLAREALDHQQVIGLNASKTPNGLSFHFTQEQMSKSLLLNTPL